MHEDLHGKVGRVRGLYWTPEGGAVSGGRGTFVTMSTPSMAIGFEGIRNDRHYGLYHHSDVRMETLYPKGTLIANHRQISMVSVEELKEIAEGLEVPEVLPEWLGVNILVEGIPSFTQLPTGVRLHLYPVSNGEAPRLYQSGDVVLENRGENLPCGNPGLAIQRQIPGTEGLAERFREVAKHRRGLVLSVEAPGYLSTDDFVRIWVPDSLLERDK